MREKHIICIKDGDIFINSDRPRIIKSPAILLDKNPGVLMGWGDKEVVQSKFINMSAALNENGNLDMANDLVYIELSDQTLTLEQRCYILKRCVEYTASGFQKDLCDKCTTHTIEEMLSWLNDQMTRMPLDLYGDD